MYGACERVTSHHSWEDRECMESESACRVSHFRGEVEGEVERDVEGEVEGGVER